MRLAAGLTAASCLLLAACGGSGGDATTNAEPGGGKTLEELWRAPGDDVGIVAGTSSVLVFAEVARRFRRA